MGALVLIDGHYYAYRYFFGMPRLSGPDGQPTGVLFAFARLLKDLIGDRAISHVAVVFDDSAPTFRHDLFPEYKAHRPPPPDELMVTQTVKADGNGVFTYAAPIPGWWGFAALSEADETIARDGEDKAVELGAVIWVQFQALGQ